MRYAGIIKNDFSAAPGTCVTFFTQGCPHKCEGCHNPETWDPTGGKRVTKQTFENIITALTENGITRNLCIMGGEPLASYNIFVVKTLILETKVHCPDAKIYLWTGYTLEELLSEKDTHIGFILKYIDVLIDGRYEQELRDITLPMRGSTNQRVLYKGIDF